MTRPYLRFLLLDGFDPDTGELALRVGAHGGEGLGPQLLRLKLFLGQDGDPLQPLKRELTLHVQMPLPPAWDRGLKLIIRAIEDELAGEGGREPIRYLWVQTQVLHPTDPKRSTLNHPVAAQAEILWDWAQRLEQEGDVLRCMELLERLLLLVPRHSGALPWLASLLRKQGMLEELLDICSRWLAQEPGCIEALVRRGEAFLALARPEEALEAFLAVLKQQPVHLLAHLGAAQAQAQQVDGLLFQDREESLKRLWATPAPGRPRRAAPGPRCSPGSWASQREHMLSSSSSMPCLRSREASHGSAPEWRGTSGRRRSRSSMRRRTCSRRCAVPRVPRPGDRVVEGAALGIGGMETELLHPEVADGLAPAFARQFILDGPDDELQAPVPRPGEAASRHAPGSASA